MTGFHHLNPIYPVMKPTKKYFDLRLKLEGNLLVSLGKTSPPFFFFALCLNDFGEIEILVMC